MKNREAIYERMCVNASEADVEKIRARLSGMNRGKVARIWDKVMDLWQFVQDPQAPWSGKVIAIAALLYLISPIDAIPDFIPVVGLGDDVGIISLALIKLSHDISKYRNGNTIE